MDLIDSLAFILSGFTVVLVALSLLWLVSALTGKLLAIGAHGAHRKPTAANLQPAQAAVAAAPIPVIPSAHLAAISAVVATITGGHGRVVSVHAPAHLSSSWAREGRTEQSSSHRVRWDWAVTGPPHIEYETSLSDLPPPPAPTATRTQ